MDLPERKKNRIAGYDYSQNGAFFITICTKNRQKVLSEITGDNAIVVLMPWGRIAEKYILNVPEIEKYVIMPDHIHFIVRLGASIEYAAPDSKHISSIVRSIKTLVTKEIGEAIFQRSYYDHVIRNQQDYDETWEYIENNPRKWVIQREGR